MIARDEEHFLPECLQRVAPAADEIVLVDTGSTDRTVEIAESFGARVLHRPWDDDFSAPRNHGIDAATGDWILVLDADEFLEEGGVAALRAAIDAPEISGYHLVFHNVSAGVKSQGVTMVRLFRRLDGVRFRNAIHEQVTPSLMRAGVELGLRLATSDIKVLHYGYGDEVMVSRAKNERNERLFRRQIEQHPDDVYSLYKYGDFLRRYGDRGEEAIELLQRALQVIQAQPPAAPRGRRPARCRSPAPACNDAARPRDAWRGCRRSRPPAPPP
jgi:glycosyltransferase involved in cell wall biosynthesis